MIKPNFTGILVRLWLVGIFLGWLAPQAYAADPPPAFKDYQPTNGEFTVLGRAVGDLLRTRDAAQFATNVAIGVPDFQAIASPTLPVSGADLQTMLAKGAVEQQNAVEASAKLLLARADALHLDFSKGDWTPQVVMPAHFDNARLSKLQAEGQWLVSVDKLEIAFDPQGPGKGEYRLALYVVLKFPGGWRAQNGIQWESFPPGVADEKTVRTLAILDKVAADQPLTAADDPALLKLGGALQHFLRDGDLQVYQKDAFRNADLIWAQMQKGGATGYSRTDLDAKLAAPLKEQYDLADAILQEMKSAGINLRGSQIQIKNASVEHVHPQGPPGSLDGLVGGPFHLTLEVNSVDKSKTGVSLSGDYSLDAGTIIRFDDDWRIAAGLHWTQIPAGVLDDTTINAIKTANYIAVNHALPPGMTAPDLDFTTVDGGKKLKLSDLRGKIVVLDFWATWCGPCQGPMAALQRIREDHPNWGDRVAIVPLSIDDTLEAVQRHVNQRGWTNTFNVWAGAGGFGAAAAQKFMVDGVPKTFIIDPLGRIVVSGHPAALPIERIVDGMVEAEGLQGQAAPDVAFTTLDGSRSMKLSDLRGKVVVLDFWATWCGPCQGPMAELQKIRGEHPGWGDKVAIVPLSIDDSPGIVRHHVDQRGWTNTFNVWAGNGGFDSAPAKAFLVSAVPATYIIDAQGKVVISGHPAALPIAQTVDSLLKPPATDGQTQSN